jgi:hypothetical protein
VTLYVDIFEPKEIVDLISMSVPYAQLSINTQGYSDYMWTACDGHRIQVERKQVEEMLGDLDGVEEQMRRHLANDVEENILIYEGMFEPLPAIKGHIQTWHKSSRKNIITPGRTYNYSFARVMSMLYLFDKAGCTVINTFDYHSTAHTLVTLYKESLKTEHTTLRRYIKAKLYVEEMNPHVLNLMSIKGGGVGEVIAKALIDRFGTFWYVVSQEPESLADTIIGKRPWGMVGTLKFLRAVGRNI